MPSTYKSQDRQRDSPRRLVVCAIILACAALYFASSVFAPLAFALFILAIVWPLQEALERALPKGLALFVTLAVTIVVVLIFASMIAWALSAVGDWLLNNVQRFQALYVQATDWLEGHGIFVAGILAERFDVIWLLRLFQDIANASTGSPASPSWSSSS